MNRRHFLGLSTGIAAGLAIKALPARAEQVHALDQPHDVIFEWDATHFNPATMERWQETICKVNSRDFKGYPPGKLLMHSYSQTVTSDDANGRTYFVRNKIVFRYRPLPWSKVYFLGRVIEPADEDGKPIYAAKDFSNLEIPHNVKPVIVPNSPKVPSKVLPN